LYPTYINWLLSTVITRRCSEIYFTVLVLGTSTSIPDCKIGAVIIKMIKSTRTTSMNGTILISDSDDCVFPTSCGIEFLTCLLAAYRPAPRRARPLVIVSVAKSLFHLCGDFEGKSVEPLGQISNVANKIVIENDRRDGGEQAHCRGYQRFRNAGRHRA